MQEDVGSAEANEDGGSDGGGTFGCAVDTVGREEFGIGDGDVAGHRRGWDVKGRNWWDGRQVANGMAKATSSYGTLQYAIAGDFKRQMSFRDSEIK